MKTIAPQFPLPIATGDTRAPLTLEGEPRRAPQPLADAQPDLLTLAPQPPAADLAAWLRRLPPAQRQRLERQTLHRPGTFEHCP